MRKFIVWAFIIICLSGCRSNTERVDTADVETVEFEDLSAQSPFGFKDLVGSIRIIHPDESATIGRISRIARYDSLLYVLDDLSGKVFVLSDNGTLINTIDRRGQGPGEYVTLSDIFVDEAESTLNILSRHDHKLLIFDILGRNLVKERQLPKAFCLMTKVEDGYLGYMSNYSENPTKPYNVWHLDENLNITDGFMKINPATESVANNSLCPFSKYNGACYIIADYSYLVAFYGNGEFGYRYRLDFGPLNAPEITKAMVNDPLEYAKISFGHIMTIDRFQETPGFLLVFALYQGQSQMMIVDKKTGKSGCINLSNNDDLPFAFGKVACADDTEIIAYTDFETMKDYVSHLTSVPEIRCIIPTETSPQNDNPYIIIYEFIHK